MKKNKQKNSDQPIVPSSEPRRAARVAVLLNGNARAVTPGLIRDCKQVVRDEDLYVSESLEQWRFISRQIVNRRYDVVLCGGGDGTFAQCVTDLTALAGEQAPAFGALSLGTGNAVASTLGASSPCLRGLAADLRQAHDLAAQHDLPMVSVEGRLAPFSGVGLDSLILEDYNHVKNAVRGTPLEQLGQGGPGYATAIATRSVWRFMFQSWPEVTIRNEGAPTCRMDLRGEPLGPPVPRGGLLYQGTAGISAASTVPYYGLGLKLFPQALLRSDRFQLRVSSVDAVSILARLPALFRGEFADERIHDFFCTAVSIHVKHPTPLQVGGDDVGRRQVVRMNLARIKAVWSAEARATARGAAEQQRVSALPRLSSVLPLHAFREAIRL